MDALDVERVQARIHLDNKENETVLRGYVRRQLIECKPRTVLARLDAILRLGDHLSTRAWLEATDDDIIDVIESHRVRRGVKKNGTPRPLADTTKWQWTTYLQHFYKAILKTKSKPAIFEHLPYRKKAAMEGYGTSKALKPQQWKALLAASPNTRDKASLAVAVETGFRASELAAVTLSSINKDAHGYWIALPEQAPLLKTGPRQAQVPVVGFANLLEAWIQEHPRSHEPGARLFVTLSNRSFGSPMTGPSIGSVVKRCGRRAGIEHIHAHVLRHTSATFKVGRSLPDETNRIIHGWRPGSQMLQYYSRSTDYVRQHMLELHGIQSSENSLLDAMGSQPCLLCGEKIPVEAAECGACGTHSSEAIQKQAEDRQALAAVELFAVDAAQALGFTGTVLESVQFLRSEYHARLGLAASSKDWAKWCMQLAAQAAQEVLA